MAQNLFRECLYVCKLMKMFLDGYMLVELLGQNSNDWPCEFRNPKYLKLERVASQKLQCESVTAIINWQTLPDIFSSLLNFLILCD
jgi:hypothetical protein